MKAALILRMMRRRKKETQMRLVSLSALYAFCTLLLFFQGSFMASETERRYETYGAWTGAVYDAPKDAEELLQSNETIDVLGHIRITEPVENFPAGSMDNAALDLSRIRVERGRLPTAHGEFAAERYALAALGNPVIGETVLIHQNGKEREMKFCGILTPWTQNWKTSGPLPVILLSETETADPSTEILLWSAQTQPFMDDLYDILDSSGGNYVYNEFGQTNPFQGSFLDSYEILIPIAVVALLVTLYALFAILPGLRFRFSLLRSLGASPWNGAAMMALEAAALFLASLPLGLLGGATVAAVSLFAATHWLTMPLRFSVDIELLSSALVLVTIMHFVEQITAGLWFSQTSMTASLRRENAFLREGTLPKLTHIRKLGFVGRCLRRRSFWHRESLLRSGLCIVVVVALSINFATIIRGRNGYRHAENSMLYSYYLNIHDTKNGLNDTEINELRSIDGIVDVEVRSILRYQETIGYGWDYKPILLRSSKFADDTYITGLRNHSGIKDLPAGEDYFPVRSIRGIPEENEEFLQAFTSHSNESQFDIESFFAGESCILILPPYKKDFSSLAFTGEIGLSFVQDENLDEDPSSITTYPDDENALHPGDTLVVETPDGKTAQLSVASILRTAAVVNGFGGSAGILVSEAFWNRIEPDAAGLYNDVLLTSHRDADFKHVDWLVEDALQRMIPELHDFSSVVCQYNNNRIGFEDDARRELDTAVRAGVYSAVLLILYTLLIIAVSIAAAERLRYRTGIYLALGATRRQSLYEAIAESSVGVIVSIAVGGILAIGFFAIELWKTYRFLDWEGLVEAFCGRNMIYGSNLIYLAAAAATVTVVLLIHLIVDTLPLWKIHRESSADLWRS
ncbi:MAG: hypothetical protein IKC24_02005 [Oscillospiraceae bacterium]|nr:hypothetical protein [Oscillospiraceae bacterium]